MHQSTFLYYSFYQLIITMDSSKIAQLCTSFSQRSPNNHILLRACVRILRQSNETTGQPDNSGCIIFLVCESEPFRFPSYASNLPLITALREIERRCLTLLFSLLVTDRLPWNFPSFLHLITDISTLRSLIILLLEVLPVFGAQELMGAGRNSAQTLVLSNVLHSILRLLLR